MELSRNEILTESQESKIFKIYNYNVIRNFLKGYKQDFINLGYIDGDVDSAFYNKIQLQDKHWIKYYPMINLYLKSFEGIDFSKIKSCIEIGSGVGGGCVLIKKYLGVESVYGVEKNKLHVWYAKYRNRKYDIKYFNLDSNSFINIQKKSDLIFTIEASSHFDNLALFAENVNNSLTNNGYFIYVDIFKSNDIDEIIKLFAQHNLILILSEDITCGVLNAINNNNYSGQTDNKIKKKVYSNDGMEPDQSSDLYKNLRSGDWRYMKFIFKHEK